MAHYDAEYFLRLKKDRRAEPAPTKKANADKDKQTSTDDKNS